MKHFHDIVAYRRAVRKYHDDPVPDAVVRRCIETAILAPSSSNLQLWEFYHVKDAAKKQALVEACMSQPAARYAPNLVVVVARHDLWRERCRANLEFVQSLPEDEPDEKPIKAARYFTKTIPTLYWDFFGVAGLLKKLFAFLVGLRRPMFREVSASEVRTMTQKSVGLAAQTFMLALAAEGYDSCPMEGFDSRRIRRILGLPRGAMINMVISCGKRAPGGIYGPRFRLPLEKVFFEV